MTPWRFEAIGTPWEIETESPLPPQHRMAVTQTIERFDRIWSRFRGDSLVSSLRQHGGTVPAPPDAQAMLAAYRSASRATAGAVNPLIGEGLEQLGYDPGLTLRGGEAHPVPSDWETKLQCTASALTLSEPAVIDIGALGKGRLVDLVTGVLAGVPGRVIVDASGDLRVRGGSARVALEHPFDRTRAIGVVDVAERALCASATNRRVWGDGLHHVLDARTGAPVHTWAATWALADEAMHADAVATALFFDGGAELAAEWGVEWVRMTTDGRVEHSAAFSGSLFLERSL